MSPPLEFNLVNARVLSRFSDCLPPMHVQNVFFVDTQEKAFCFFSRVCESGYTFIQYHTDLPTVFKQAFCWILPKTGSIVKRKLLFLEGQGGELIMNYNSGSSLIQRIRRVFDFASAAEIARRLGVYESRLSRYFSGNRSIPGADFFRKIGEVTGADLHWLITGEGQSPFRRDREDVALKASEDAESYVSVIGQTKPKDNDEREIQFVNAPSEKLTLPASLNVVEVKGDELIPVLWDGQYALVDRDAELCDNDLVMVETWDGSTYCKRWHSFEEEVVLSNVTPRDKKSSTKIKREEIKNAYKIVGAWYG